MTKLLFADAQVIKKQQGIVFKGNTGIRIAAIKILNLHNRCRTQSDAYGVFTIPATTGDTLTFTGDGFQTEEFLVEDFKDKLIFLRPLIQLNEVVVKEASLQSEIKEVQRGYREKSVFYTGTPHYYYLALKPMTFIYENFKSEVKEARRFNRYARKETELYEITSRFNKTTIKRAIPIKDSELEKFEDAYLPTLKQIENWNDYQLIEYIQCAYLDFEKLE